MGLFDLLRAAVQPAAAARAGYLQGQDQEQDKQRKTLLETVKNAREQALTNAQIAHLNAQAHSLDEGQWGPAFNAVDEDGKPILVQQHKQSGALRRAMITDGATDASSATSPAMPSIAEPKPANLTLPPDSQDMTGADAGSSPISPTQQGTSAQPGQPTPKKTALSPYVKPVTSTRPASMIPGTPEWLAAQEAAAQIHAKYRPAAKDQTQVIQGIDPNTGQPSFAEYDKTTHKLRPIDFAPKPAGAGGGSLSPEERAKMVAQANLDNQTMKAYEAKVLAGKASVGTVAGIAGMAATGKGVSSVLGNTAVGMMDPDYQRYITAQRSYGRIMGNLQSKRYTDHQAEVERSISGLQGNDLAGTIQYKQQLRDASLNDAVSSPSSGGRGSSRAIGRGHDLSAPPKGSAGPDTPGDIDLGGAPSGSRPQPSTSAGAFGYLVPKKPEDLE